MTLRENISNEIASPQQVQDASFTGTTGSNNLQNIVKGAKFVDSGISGWDLVDQDIVAYKDQMRRGLQFLFAMMQKTSLIGDKSTFKIVSVYQKGINNEDGDFVVVSRYMNDPHNVRVVDVTNDWYGDPDPEPMEIISKVIEMADSTGMTRNINEYGDYGKTTDMIETADTLSRFRASLAEKGVELLTDSKNLNSKSPISNLVNSNEGTKEGEKVLSAVTGATQEIQQPSAMSRIGRGVFGAISNLFKSGVSTLAKGTTATKATTVSPIAVGVGAVAGAQKGILEQQKGYEKELKTQKTEQYKDEKVKMQEKLGILGLGTKLAQQEMKGKTDIERSKMKEGYGKKWGGQKAAFEQAYEQKRTSPFASSTGKPGETYSVKDPVQKGFTEKGGTVAGKFSVPGQEEPFFKTVPSKTAPKKQKVTTPKADKRTMGTTQFSQPYTTKMY
jgi:hypothetical protein